MDISESGRAKQKMASWNRRDDLMFLGQKLMERNASTSPTPIRASSVVPYK